MSQDREAGRADAVAIIGMSCRFAPDLDSPDKLWSALAGGRSTVSEMPDKRWDPYASSSPQATAILRETTRLGSFLDDIEGFDAEFFGISPREADFLDPQQRLVLELAWEALVDAGIPPLSLRGTEASVFVAANSNDYGRRLLEDIPRTGAWAVNGTTYYGIANRVSYVLDLRGPSVAVDTACAGSLSALHLACQSLRLGETPVAVVGGINIMATPALFVALDAAGATSPDGRSKAFDKVADGYGRGEGAGVVVLKRLRDARRDGDPVLALIRGSGVFQDGRSDGMMAPNNEAQEHMLWRVYERAGIAPRTVSYVEAHGTGTPVGDREEATALARVFGQGRGPAKPCLIGSIKPNIGHVEAASGIAGVIKSVLSLQREQIAPSLHTEPNPDFDWRRSGLRLVGELTPWPAGSRPRRAGVSSYGVGGTIAHLILEEAPRTARRRRPTVDGHEPSVFPLSAMSEPGLRELAGATAGWLREHPDVRLAAVGHTLAGRRSHLAYRAAVVASSTVELEQRLRAVADGERLPTTVTARTAPGRAVDPVWVFSGHGAQWAGMGRQLLGDEPSFAAAMDALEQVFRDELGWTPREAIVQGGPWTTSAVQAMTFAMQIGLAEVWRRHGVTPGAVLGHSVGEIAAAVVAGTLELQEAARFACRRAAALERLDGLGGMAMVGLPLEDCRQRLAGRRDVVAAIAASPHSTVISGDRDAVERLGEQWREEGVEVRRVETEVAFHSPQVEAVMGEVGDAAGAMTPREPQITLYNSALPDPRASAARDSGYWVTNLRQPVRFTQAIEAAVQDGHRLFLEVSSHPVVTHSIIETLEHLGVEDGMVLHSTRRDAPERESILVGLGGLHCNGGAIDWSRQHPGAELVGLPAVSWQHRPYWIFPATAGERGLGGGHDPERHSLLGGQMTISGTPTRRMWQTYLDMSCRPYPQDHEVVGVEITPAAAIINTFMAATAHDGRLPVLTDVVLRTPVAVSPPRVVQIIAAGDTVQLSTRIADSDGADDDELAWITHCTAAVDPAGDISRRSLDVAQLRSRCPEQREWSTVDEMFRRMGVGGYAFPWEADELRRNDREQLAVLTVEAAPARTASSWAHVIDAALTISAVVVTPEDARRLWMSSHIESVAVSGEPPARIIVHTSRSARSPHDTVDVVVADEHGQVVCEVSGLRFAALQDEFGVTAAPRDLVHELVWRERAQDQDAGGQDAGGQDAGGEAEVRRVVLVGSGEDAGELDAALRRAGVECVTVASPEELEALDVSDRARFDAFIVTTAQAGPDESPPRAASDRAWTLIRTAQRLADAAATVWDGAAPPPKLWCLTHGVRDATTAAALAHAPLWGVSRIIAGEHPELWGGVIDIAAFGPDTGARVLRLLRTAAGEEDIIALTGDETLVARLSPLHRPDDGAVLRCEPSGSYLITGGLGSLGLAVARWLADRGARRLLLVGRRGLPPRPDWDSVQDAGTRRQIEQVRALEAIGVTVQTPACDITDPDQVAAILEPTVNGLPPVRGIIHAAGVVRDAMVDKVDPDGLRDVLAPKAAGAMVLHELFPPGSLDFFVMFSSCGQFARLTGQASYAAANSFLDALAAHRRANGDTGAVSIGWTAWQGMGMSEAIASTMLEANSRGLGAVSGPEAFRAWSYAERFDVPYQAILRVLPTPPHAFRPPMFRELIALDQAGGGDGGQAGFTIDWAGVPENEARERLAADVREQVAAELNLTAGDVDPKRPLVEMGADSVMTVALRVRMQRRYGLDLPPNILWSKPTVTALASHLVESLRPAGTD